VWLNKSNFTLVYFSATSVATKVQNNFFFCMFYGAQNKLQLQLTRPKPTTIPTTTDMPSYLVFFGEIFISHNLAGSSNWQLSRFTHSFHLVRRGGGGGGFIKRIFIIYINSFVLFAMSIPGTWPMAHGHPPIYPFTFPRASA